MWKQVIGMLGVATMIWTSGAAEQIEVETRYLTETPLVEGSTFHKWQPPYVRGIYYDGPEYRGEPTKVFAYIGIPETKPGEKVPGIVLVHGGGGTAFEDWVNLWMSRGYAAIAMDLCGSIPVHPVGEQGWMRLSSGAGPMGWDAAFEQKDEALEDQWPYYAANAIARANTLLGSMPEVDAERIGITGISWGGYLTCLAASTDSRYIFAAPVYGCGFLGDESAWMGRLQNPEMAKWLKECDPSSYLQQATMPMLWVTGTNDFAYPLTSVKKSADLVPAPVTFSITPRMPHGHGGAGELPEALRIFADSFCQDGAPLPLILKPELQNGILRAQVRATLPVQQTELHYTRDAGAWPERLWEVVPATWDAANQSVSAPLPEGTVQCFFNILDERNVPASSELVIIEADAGGR